MERSKAFRVRAPLVERVRVVFGSEPDSHRTDGCLQELGPSDAVIKWLRPGAPVVPLGDVRSGLVVLPGQDVEVRLNCAARHDDPHHRTYRFDLSAVGLTESFQDILVATFDRRAHPRVTPDPSATVAAVISRLDGTADVRARIRDLSDNGLALIAHEDADRGLADETVFRVRLALPTEPAPIDLAAHVIARQRVTGGVLYRLQFAEGIEPDAHRRLVSYVEERIGRRAQPVV